MAHDRLPLVGAVPDESAAAGLRLDRLDAVPRRPGLYLLGALGSRGIELFSVIACGDQVAAKKPAPDIYQLALRHLGVDPEQAVALEDSRNGLLSATRAGLWTVVSPTYWTEHQDFAEAGLVLPSLAALSYAELARLGDRRPRNHIAALYEGALR